LYPGPTVAFIDGHAIAGGAILALCCDRAVAVDEPKLRIGLNEVAIGVRFPPRILAIVEQQVPRATIDEVVLGAQLFAPRDAVRVGLVDELGDLAVAEARLAALAKHPRETYAWTKARLRGDENTLCGATEHEAFLHELAPLWASREVKERLTSVLGKK
jgi:enoyl-CoA hydratase/carnithine racemase